ncbi:flavin reductase family protein [Bosea minatitlanensis]|uniref:Flavin reductase n=1 Tax=Bosea minatitlanensis TaxID=128782 RepID=A0ABW0F456_9HYPH|nr:flavin reductase family protein [Bosea minatitlanensis]MCT4493450.1 flavin reductase family protein [Bosea minatitlanensis]
MKSPVESGTPAADRGAFRRTLGEFATGVTVITTTVDGASYGLTSNSFSSVSLDPPLVLWSIRRESQSFAAFEACTHFAVNVLADDQIALSQLFAKSAPNKFQDLVHGRGRGDAPLLHGIAASFECRRTCAYEGGDHLILVGEVETFSRYDRAPLIFSKGRYAVTANHPDIEALAVETRASSQEGESEVLSNLMIRAYSLIAAEVERARMKAGLGLTLMQARLLRACAANPGSTLEALLPELLLDFNASQNVLGALISLGLVTADSQGRVRLTPAGEVRVKEIIAHARQCEELLFRNVPAEELATMNSTLSRIIDGNEAARRAAAG